MMELLRNRSGQCDVHFLVHQRRVELGAAGDFDVEILGAGAALLRVPTLGSVGPVAFWQAFRQSLSQLGRPDVVHIHLNAKSWPAVLAARLSGVPVVIVHAHADLVMRGPWLRRMIARLEFAFSKLVFRGFASAIWGCSTNAVQKFLLPGSAGRQQTMVINNAVTLAPFLAVTRVQAGRLRQALGAPGDGLLIGCVGRIVRHKRSDFLIDVMAVLRGRGVDATLVLAGREDDAVYAEEIRAAARRFDLLDRVRFLGSRSDIPELMAAFDVFAGPALREGFGLVAAEAQAAGTPCVLSRGFPDSVDMGLDLVDFREDYDAKAWADAITRARGRRVTDKASIADAFARAGFSAVENTWRVEAAYRELIQRGDG